MKNKIKSKCGECGETKTILECRECGGTKTILTIIRHFLTEIPCWRCVKKTK